MRHRFSLIGLVALIALGTCTGLVLAPPVFRPPPRPVFRPAPRPNTGITRPPTMIMPRPIPRSITLPQQVRQIIQQRPGEALIMLRRERSVLTPAVQAALARQAVLALALRSRHTQTPQAALQEVRQARGNGKERVDDQAERILEALEARLAQRVLMALLKEIADLAGKNRWVEIGQKAQQHLQQQQAPADAHKVLEALVQVGNQIDGLSLCKRHWTTRQKGDGRKRPHSSVGPTGCSKALCASLIPAP